jgi:hypothetical protein
MRSYLPYNNLHIDIHTDKPETNALDDSWLHCNYSYPSAVRDDIDASDALPGTSLTVPISLS